MCFSNFGLNLNPGPGEPDGQQQQPNESWREPDGVGYVRGRGRTQLAPVQCTAAAVPKQRRLQPAVHPAGNVRPAGLQWRSRRLQREVGLAKRCQSCRSGERPRDTDNSSFYLWLVTLEVQTHPRVGWV